MSNVDHPEHYNQGQYECIDIMRDVFGDDAVRDFCKLNAFKYIWRESDKNGDEDLSIESCLLEMELSATKAVGVGSLNGSSKLGITRTAMKCILVGEEITGVGSLYGKEALFIGDNGNFTVNIRAEKATAVGAMQGKSEVRIQNALLSTICNGKYSSALGGYGQDTKISIENGEIKTDVWNETGVITGAKDEDIRIKNGRIGIKIQGGEKGNITDNP